MNTADARRCEVLLSLQRALLGEVAPNLRAVTVTYTGNAIHFDAFFDGPIGDAEREAMSLVETEVLADFPPEHRVTHQVIRLDAQALVPKDRTWVYHRKEPL
jgi:hypothetical protein